MLELLRALGEIHGSLGVESFEDSNELNGTGKAIGYCDHIMFLAAKSHISY